MIEVKELTRLYGDKIALNAIQFKINNGKIYGVLGAPGAGKSTLLALLAGAVEPTAGSVRINGFDMSKDAMQARRCIGYCPPESPFYEEMTAFEFLQFAAEARGLSGLRVLRRIHEALELTETEAIRDRLIRNLSPSHRRRIGIAETLLGGTDILILDEPTAGLDPLQRNEIRELIRLLGESRTVVISSSDPVEACELCAHLLVLQNGKLVHNSPAEEIDRDELALLCRSAEPETNLKIVERDGEYELIDVKKEKD